MGIDYYQPQPDPGSSLEEYYVVVPFQTKLVLFRTSSRKPEDLAWKSTSLDRKGTAIIKSSILIYTQVQSVCCKRMDANSKKTLQNCAFSSFFQLVCAKMKKHIPTSI